MAELLDNLLRICPSPPTRRSCGRQYSPAARRSCLGRGCAGRCRRRCRSVYATPSSAADVAGNPREEHLRGFQRSPFRGLHVQLELRRVVVRDEVLGDNAEQPRAASPSSSRRHRAPPPSDAGARIAARPDRRPRSGYRRTGPWISSARPATRQIRLRSAGQRGKRRRPRGGRPRARRRPVALNQRAANIGVSVKLTNMLTMIVAAMVMPNDLRNRPTMPSIMAIGRNTATSESVMAITARPISPVAAIAASKGEYLLLFDEAEDVFHHHDRVVDHDAHRKRQRQQRDAVEREAHVIDDGEGGDDRGRESRGPRSAWRESWPGRRTPRRPPTGCRSPGAPSPYRPRPR